MNKKTLITAALVCFILMGCEDDGSAPLALKSKPSKELFSNNGLYLNSSDLVVMVVDSTRNKNHLVIGDFHHNAVYFTDKAITAKDSIQTTGLTFANEHGIKDLPNQKFKAEFVDNKALLMSQVQHENLIYTLDKTVDSLPLTQIIGTHINPENNSSYTINADGSFSVKGNCAIAGQLERNGAYFDISRADVLSCKNPDLNGAYKGVFLTIRHKNQNYLAGLLENKNAVLWSIMPQS